MLRKLYAFLLLASVVILPLHLAVASSLEIQVMAINTEWLWTPFDGKVDGSRFNKGDMSAADYHAELEFYTQLVRKNQVDVLALSEIENAMVANDLAARLGAPWQAFFKQGRDTATGQDLAILSRLPLIEGSLSDFGFPSGALPLKLDGSGKEKRLSKVVGVALRLANGDSLAVLTSHFLSRRNDNIGKSKNRIRQAYALRKAIRVMQNRYDHLLVMGDFNDWIGSTTIKVLINGNELHSAEQHCGARGSYDSIDHILYDPGKGLRCEDFKKLDLAGYSDHPGIWARLKVGP